MSKCGEQGAFDLIGQLQDKEDSRAVRAGMKFQECCMSAMLQK